MLLTVPPQLDANETTDKGYINQIAVLHNRAGLVESLYLDPAPPAVILVEEKADSSTGATAENTSEITTENNEQSVDVSSSSRSVPASANLKRRRWWPFGRS
jgi:hypothetical protein